jgi:polysaccharide biosynthesis/export protein/SLBB domain-containing protein
MEPMKQLESSVSVCNFRRGWMSGTTRIVGLALLAFALAERLPAQDIKRAGATRAELQASLAELEQYIASSGYSGRLRDAKRREAELIKSRLVDGDLQVGDQIELAVVGEQAFTGTFPILAGRVISLPGLPEIPLKGVLRSEAKEYLTAQLGKYIRDPQVRVRTTVRLSVFGSVGKPGFLQAPADALATDVITQAGGPAQDADLEKAFVRRGDEVIWPKGVFREAMQKGLTVDELNLRAGDEMVIDPRKRPGSVNFYTVIGTVSAITGLVYLGIQIF